MNIVRISTKRNKYTKISLEKVKNVIKEMDQSLTKQV